MGSVVVASQTRIVEIGFNEADLANFVEYVGSKSDDPEELGRFLLEYPTVYVVHHDDRSAVGDRVSFSIYVGETNDIERRTLQHLRQDPKKREDWKALASDPYSRMYIIGHELFNKSLTLDIEDRLMGYLLGSPNIRRIYNRRPNPQRNYYTKERIDEIFESIWETLNAKHPELFVSDAVIKNSALFKASPFHNLTLEQIDAKGRILDAIDEAMEKGDRGQLILVSGQAGSGKTVLLSSLFLDIMERANIDGKNIDSPLKNYLLVNHKEQLTVYQEIAKKLGFFSAGNKGVVTLPSTFINSSDPSNPADVVLVDEAHLLWTQGTQGYRGKNQLEDLISRAKVVVAVMDLNQVLRNKQYWEPERIEWLRNSATQQINLRNQLRIKASKDTMLWLRKFIDKGEIGQIPEDLGYDLRIYDDPSAMHDAIRARELSSVEFDGLSRMVASYDWPYVGKGQDSVWNVEIDGTFCAPWNYQLKPAGGSRKTEKKAWAEQEHTVDEIGSTFTIQGFDLNYAGVIIGPSVGYEDGHIVYRPERSANKDVRHLRSLINGNKVNVGELMIRNELNVLLTRGVRGLYIYAVDQGLREALINASRGKVG